MVLTGQFYINGQALNVSPINGGEGDAPVLSGMLATPIDCRHVTIEFTAEAYDHFEVLRIQNWGLTDGFVNAVEHIDGPFYLVETSRTFAGVLYIITANV